MQRKFWIVAVASILALSACGDTLLEQGLMGAGAGAGAAAILGGDTPTGAVVGAGTNIYCQQTGNCPKL